MKRILCLFTKNLEKGRVKTRLAKDIGDELALEFYTACLQDLVHTHRDQEYELVIFSTDASTFSIPHVDLHGISVHAQQGETFGKRLCHALKTLCDTPAHVCMIGGDSPHLSVERITQAFVALKTHDCVFGPCRDGGDYLIGMSTYIDVFEGVDWSSHHTFSQTLLNVTHKNVSYSLLPKDFDVDTIADVDQLSTKRGIPQTHKVLEKLHDIDHHTNLQ